MTKHNLIPYNTNLIAVHNAYDKHRSATALLLNPRNRNMGISQCSCGCWLYHRDHQVVVMYGFLTAAQVILQQPQLAIPMKYYYDHILPSIDPIHLEDPGSGWQDIIRAIRNRL